MALVPPASSMKKSILLLFCILSAVILGALIADLTDGIPQLAWLSFGTAVGISPGAPLVLDLSVLVLTFGVSIGINVAQVITISIALFIYIKYLSRSRI